MATKSPGVRVHEIQQVHEIRLNGAQLLFVLISATVVLALPFVGGVHAGLDAFADSAGLTESGPGTPGPEAPPARQALAASWTQPVGGAANATYHGGLEARIPPDATRARVSTEPVAEPGTSPAPTEAPPATSLAPTSGAPAPRAAAAAATPPGPTVVTGAAAGRPAGPVMTIQVMASPVRSEADAMAEQLIGKGYEAYVLAPASGAPALFRVRVGRFIDRGEAHAMVARLANEEKLETWLVQLPSRVATK